MSDLVSVAEKRTGPTVAVLFARRDSIYKTLPGTDVWDEDRDALKWPGGSPVVAHPPCRLWGEMSHMSIAPASEKGLALFAVNQLRLHGGVLEHPAKSKLWKEAGLPNPGEYDAWGGFTICVPQFWWGHPARKNTRLYIVGCTPFTLPQVPLVLGDAEYTFATNRKALKKRLAAGITRRQDRELTRKWRDATPPQFAAWLIEVARRCVKP